MKYSPVTFETNDHVARFLGEIKQYWKQKEKEEVPAHEVKNQEPLNIETLVPGQTLTPEDVSHVLSLLKWLNLNHAIDQFETDYAHAFNVAHPGEPDYVIPEKLHIRVRDIEPVLFLEKTLFGGEHEPGKNLVRTEFREMTLFLDGNQVRKFQSNGVKESFSFGNVFSLLWTHRLHQTKMGGLNTGLSQRLSIGEFETRLRKKTDGELSSNFIRDIRANLAKIREDDGPAVALEVTKENGLPMLQLIVTD